MQGTSPALPNKAIVFYILIKQAHFSITVPSLPVGLFIPPPPSPPSPLTGTVQSGIAQVVEHTGRFTQASQRYHDSTAVSHAVTVGVVLHARHPRGLSSCNTSTGITIKGDILKKGTLYDVPCFTTRSTGDSLSEMDHENLV